MFPFPFASCAAASAAPCMVLGSWAGWHGNYVSGSETAASMYSTKQKNLKKQHSRTRLQPNGGRASTKSRDRVKRGKSKRQSISHQTREPQSVAMRCDAMRCDAAGTPVPPHLPALKIENRRGSTPPPQLPTYCPSTKLGPGLGHGSKTKTRDCALKNPKCWW